MESPNIYVVSYWDNGDIEPTVTVFDNVNAAESCRDYFASLHDNCCIDTTYIYSSFEVH